MASSFARCNYSVQFFLRISTNRRAISMFELTRSALHSLRQESATQPLFYCHSRDQQEAFWKASAKHSTQSPQVFITVPPQPLTSEAAPADPGKNGCKILTNVEVNTEKKQLLVSWEGGAESQAFPFIWLRDHCHCPECIHLTALDRLPSAQVVNVDVVADSAELSSDGTKLIVRWDDDHKSQFMTDWLRYYRFDESPDDQLLNPELRFLGANAFPKCFDFPELLADDLALYDWLSDVLARGVAVVKNAPAEVRQVHKLAGRVAFLRQTLFGETCHIRTKHTPSSVGYTSGALALHVDFAYYMRKPGLAMMHCIEQAEGKGGENLISDGFKVAMDLKEADPEAFRLLTTYQFEYSAKGADYLGRLYLHSRHPVIRLNERGDIEAISISNHTRDPMLRVPVDQVLPFYCALDKYCQMLQQPENVLKYKMQKGDILTFNNKRMLHGRSSFQMTENDNRYLELGYLEWDEIYSRLRVLAMQFADHTKE
ncbi:gamma-butyrobetaine dioxygenase-like [Acanthaster planci]|uniref:Gamma-butyrobetaine dioxygenase-like n=1 Tax=Acanthaster planci TaxID=133434 RepID=A0A8B7YA53_ACAPL|nr:gamma-butyrobetaine dioxygenase-like [Acanthaster planci]